MNYVLLFLNIWSFRRELLTVLFTFLFVLLIPIIAVIVIANAGFQVVSDTLVKIDPLTKTVQLFDPTGKVYKTINLKPICQLNYQPKKKLCSAYLKKD